MTNKSVVVTVLLVTAALVAGFFYLQDRRPRTLPPAPKGAVSSADKPKAQGTAPVNSAPPSQPNKVSYELAKDVGAYVAQLEASGAKPAEINTAKAKAIEECFMFSRMPNYAIDTWKARQGIGSADQTVQENYAKLETARCLSYATGRQLKAADAKQLYTDAANAGSPEAQAHITAGRLNRLGDAQPSSEVTAQINGLIATQDPGAVFELSESFGINSKFTGPYFGNAKTAAAWQLVACDLGLDCSEGSSLMIGFCLNGGVYCGPGDLRNNMSQLGFSPADFNEVLSLERAIYSKLKNSTDSFIHP